MLSPVCSVVIFWTLPLRISQVKVYNQHANAIAQTSFPHPNSAGATYLVWQDLIEASRRSGSLFRLLAQTAHC